MQMSGKTVNLGLGIHEARIRPMRGLEPRRRPGALPCPLVRGIFTPPNPRGAGLPHCTTATPRPTFLS